jgi:presenilin-like A22 family membrane protease
MILAQNQRRIFSILAIILIAVTVFFGFNIQAVKADSNMMKCVITENEIDKIVPCKLIETEKSWVEKITEGVIIGTTTTALTSIALTGSCYLVDIAATSVFPPAIALAPACSMIGVSSGLSGVGNAVLQTVK